MRILILSQWFQPESFYKGVSFAQELIKLGHEVEVLTGFPNYPGGKLYDGYRIKLFQREVIGGIPVIRVPLYPSHDGNSIKRILNYASFALSASLLGVLLVKRPDVVYVYHPPATVGLPALFLRFFHHTPFVYDIQDLWPDTLEATGMVNNRIAIWMVQEWCRLIYSQAAKIVVLSPGFREMLIRRGVPEHKIEVIYNWCEDSKIQSTTQNEDLSRKLGMAGRFNVVFAGTMGKAQALDAVLEAAGLLCDKSPRIQFVFVGGGIDVNRLKDEAAEQGLTNVRFLSRRPPSEIGDILNLGDVLLVHLRNDPLFRITIPGKTQAYMASGRPILMGVRGDAKVLVEKAGAGLACTPEDPQDIADAVEKFYNMTRKELDLMGQSGKMFYEEELSLRIGVRRFEEIFQSVAVN